MVNNSGVINFDWFPVISDMELNQIRVSTIEPRVRTQRKVLVMYLSVSMVPSSFRLLWVFHEVVIIKIKK